MGFDESKHPRVPAGSPEGGRFASAEARLSAAKSHMEIRKQDSYVPKRFKTAYGYAGGGNEKTRAWAQQAKRDVRAIDAAIKSGKIYDVPLGSKQGKRLFGSYFNNHGGGK